MDARWAWAGLVTLSACNAVPDLDGGSTTDAITDAGLADRGVDAGLIDSGPQDSGRHDAGFLMDAFASDAEPEDSGPPISLEVNVVTGPAPVLPLLRASLRAESTDGTFVEGATDANGRGTLVLDPAMLPVSLTVAKAGYTATSILGVTASIVGPIRLDPLPTPTNFPTFPVSGFILGKENPLNPVRIDAWELSTVVPTGSTFDTVGYLTTPLLPLRLVALELDVGGHPLNVASTALLARTATGGVLLQFPSPPEPAVVTNVTVNLPSGGAIGPVEGYPAFTNYVAQLHSAEEGAYALVGTEAFLPRGGLPPSTYLWQVHSFGGAVAPDVAAASLDFPLPARLNLYLVEFGFDQIIDVERVDDVWLGGSTLADLSVLAIGTGYDAAVISVGEGPNGEPGIWRCVMPLNAIFVTGFLPQLPTGILPQQIGLPESGDISVGLVMVKMRVGSVWSLRNANGGQPEIAYSVGSNYRIVDAALR